MTDVVKTLLEGGPIALASLCMLAYFWERKKNDEAQEKLMELARAQIESTLKHEQSIKTNTEILKRFLDKA